MAIEYNSPELIYIQVDLFECQIEKKAMHKTSEQRLT
jgi:hypothetical protein